MTWEWIDPWINPLPLKTLFPALFRLEKNKWCMVADRVGNNDFVGAMTWEWKKYPATVQEIAEVVECSQMVSGTTLDSSRDLWEWNKGRLQQLTVQETKSWIKSFNSDAVGHTFRWSSWLPAKCNIFMWRTLLDRIPTKVALRRRNILVGDCKCVLCGEVEETAEHVFTVCRFADGVWNGIARWCHIPPIFLFSINDIQTIVDQSGSSNRKKELLHGILVLTCWRIWKARNEKVFTKNNTKITEIISDVKSMGFLWYKSRGKCDVDWKGWHSSNLSIF
ncbi:uncharacterized protein LOC143568697 [Bidens hawaiensis]|uniref:uncharacterized protein LOC143568697 n=2 Tax=Bidens hawaiensis TaxID=980011 RepID=UPI004049BAE0